MPFDSSNLRTGLSIANRGALLRSVEPVRDPLSGMGPDGKNASRGHAFRLRADARVVQSNRLPTEHPICGDRGH